MAREVNKPRIICVGSNIESEVVLRVLIKHKVNIVLLVTLPSKESDGVCDYVDLHPLCESNNIRTIDTKDINSVETCMQIKEESPDYIFVLGWSQIFKASLLNIPRKFVVGSHPSPLPEGRGRAPVPWTILQEKKKSAVTLFRMDVGVDSGDILLQKWFDIPKNASALTLYNLVVENLCNAFYEIHDRILSNNVEIIVQDISKATYRAKRTLSDGYIDFNKSAYDIEKLIRAVSEPYPGAYSYYQRQKVHIFRASLDNIPPYIGVVGQILLRKKNSILVQTGDTPIWLSKFTVKGEEISFTFFKVGEKLGYDIEDELYTLNQEINKLKENLNRN